MKSCHLAIVILILTIHAAARTGESTAAQKCGVDKNRPAQRIFADQDGKQSWREYQSLNDVPELQSGFDESAMLWTMNTGSSLVTIDSSGEDIATHTEYCFGKTGRLVQLGYEVRTAWGWVYRIQGPIVEGTLIRKKSGFFSTTTGEPVGKPSEADEVEKAGDLKPHIYLLRSQLPFAQLLTR